MKSEPRAPQRDGGGPSRDAGDAGYGLNGPKRAALVPLSADVIARLRSDFSDGRPIKGARREGEVRLDVGDGADGGVAIALSLRDDDAPAFVRTRHFNLSHLDDGPDGHLSTAMATELERLAAAIERPTVARSLIAAMRADKKRPKSGVAVASAESLPGDIRFAAGEPLLGFDPAQCSRRSEVLPRRLGRDGLVLVGADGDARIWRASVPIADGGGVHVDKNVSGKALHWRDGEWHALALVERCRDCPVRHDCAGCFTGDDHPGAAGLDALAGRIGAREDEGGAAAELLGSERFRETIDALAKTRPARATGPTAGDAEPAATAERPNGRAPTLVVEAATLADHAGRVDLARALRRQGSDADLLLVGRRPAALLIEDEEPPPTCSPWGIAAIDPSRVARSLRSTVLRLGDALLPGRDGANPWWLQAEPRVAGAAEPPLARHILILANRKCVTVCRYCNLPLRLRGGMLIEEVVAAIEEASVRGAEDLELFGGEVTLRADLMTLIAATRDAGLRPYVTTTGVGLSDDDLAKLAVAGIHDLSISVDSADPAIHDDLKNREGMHASALHAARTLHGNGAPNLGFNTVITRDNLEGLPDVIELAADLGLGGATFFFCQPLAELGNETPALDEAEVARLVDVILPRCREIAEARGVHLGVRPSIDREEADRAEVIARVGRGVYSRIFETDAPCRLVDHLVSIQSGGDVRLCNQPLMQFVDHPVVGNLREQTLQEILTSPRAKSFRARAGRIAECQWCTVDHLLDGRDPGLDAIVAGEARDMASGGPNGSEGD